MHEYELHWRYHALYLHAPYRPFLVVTGMLAVYCRVSLAIEQTSNHVQCSHPSFQRHRVVTTRRGWLQHEGGVEVFNAEGIIKEYQSEFINRLSHKEIHPDFKEYEEVTNRLLNLYLETSDDHEPDFEDKEVDSLFRQLKKGKACAPDSEPPEIYKSAGSNQRIKESKNQRIKDVFFHLAYIQYLLK